MATDFLGRTLNIGDDVFFLNYNGTSANLERGKITKVFPHTAEIGKKRRAEYKIVKILTDVAPVVRCKDCKHYRNHPNGLCYLHTEPKANARGYSGNSVCVEPDDFCSYGEPKEGAHADDHD